MAVDFESGAGKVVKSLLDASPAYYFAVSGYTVYDVPSSNLSQNLEETQEVRILSQSDCLLRISQSCLEQSLSSVTILVLMVDQVFVSGCSRYCVT